MEEPRTIDDPPSEAPTVLERPARRPPPSASGATDTRGSGVSLVRSPADAVRADEMARSRALSIVGMTGGLATALTSPLFARSITAQLLLVVGAALLASTNAYLFWVAREPARFTERRLMAIWVLATLGVLGVVFVFGPFSGAVAALVLGVYVSARNASRRVARATYLTIALAHAPMAFAPLVTDLSDVTVVANLRAPVVVVLAEGLLQLVLFGTYAAATSSQRTMLSILGELEGAIRRVARREVQLEEAREDLARRAPVGAEGRLTGVRLGSYELGVLIGRGGMGEVYEAASADAPDRPPAAVKVLLPEALQNEHSVLRFLREARAASSLDSPHIVRVLETGEPPADLPYIAMERLHGVDLSSHLRRLDGLMPRADVVELVRQIGLGLAATGDAGIVHRDIKPQNLFRAVEGGEAPTWKILDFGVSKLADHGGTLTHGRLLGTPSYMAPEQALLEDVDARTDLYGLGAVAYRCLVGWPPFPSGDVAKTVYRVVHRMPLRPSAHAELPREVDLVLAIALAKRPDARFADAAALSTALGAALGGRIDPAHARRARALLDALPWSR